MNDTPKHHIRRRPLKTRIGWVDRTVPPVTLPDRGPGWLKRLWARINGHKSTLCYIGMLAGGVLTLIPATAVLGKALFCVAFGSEGASLIHREGKQSGYGKPGEFGFKDLLAVLQDVIRAVMRLWHFFERRKS